MVFNTIKSFVNKRSIRGVAIALCVIATLTYLSLSLPNTDQEIRMIRLKLFLIRSKIDNFYSMEGRYPNSLKELEEFVGNLSEAGFDMISLKEKISNPDGIEIVSGVLDGEGGWYYDKTTGEFRLNITRPIKHYKKLYFGKYRNHIPSDW